MRRTSIFRHLNFAARLVERLGRDSELLDAPSSERICAAELSSLIADFAASFVSVGLAPGDCVLIGCNLRPGLATTRGD